MACLPGMPCFGPLVKIVYPPSCDPFANRIIDSDHVEYQGDNLSCTGIQNCDTLTVALQKIDNKICSDQFVAQIIQTIENNDVLKAYFCQLVSSCSPTTTTTSTTVEPTTTTTTSSTSSTTTTTTTNPAVAYTVKLGANQGAACGNPSTSTVYINGTLDVYKIVYVNIGLSIALLGVKYLVDDTDNLYELNESTGEVIAILGNCGTTSTTTSTTTTSAPSFSVTAVRLFSADPCTTSSNCTVSTNDNNPLSASTLVITITSGGTFTSLLSGLGPGNVFWVQFEGIKYQYEIVGDGSTANIAYTGEPC